MSVNYSIPAYRISLIRDGACPSRERPKIRESKTAAQILQQYLDGADREHFVVLLLDRKNVVIGIHTVSMGSLSASIVHPRETFKAAIMMPATAIICGHNHPAVTLPCHRKTVHSHSVSLRAGSCSEFPCLTISLLVRGHTLVLPITALLKEVLPMPETTSPLKRGNWTDNPCYYISVIDGAKYALVLALLKPMDKP